MERHTAESVKRLVDEFQKIRSKYAKYGAADSEIRYHLLDVIEMSLRGEKFYDLSSDRWELYSHSMDCSEAAAALNKAAKALNEAILDLGAADLRTIESAGEDLLWS